MALLVAIALMPVVLLLRWLSNSCRDGGEGTALPVESQCALAAWWPLPAHFISKFFADCRDSRQASRMKPMRSIFHQPGDAISGGYRCCSFRQRSHPASPACIWRACGTKRFQNQYAIGYIPVRRELEYGQAARPTNSVTSLNRMGSVQGLFSSTTHLFHPAPARPLSVCTSCGVPSSSSPSATPR